MGSNRESFLGLAALVMMATVGGEMAMGYEADGEQSMNADPCQLVEQNLTTTWNLSMLYPEPQMAWDELKRLQDVSAEMNRTFRPGFEQLTGPVLLEYIEAEKAFGRNLSLLWAYAYGNNSLNVNDPSFEKLLSEVQNLSTAHQKDTAFAEVVMKSLPEERWDQLFSQTPALEPYRAWLQADFIRFYDHRPRDEAQVARLADLENQRMRLETESEKLITNNVTVAGNITLTNGEEYLLDSESYYTLLSIDPDRENRRRAYDKRFFHLINESERMAQIYQEKSVLDDKVAEELNYSGSYAARLFDVYLTDQQVEDLNSVCKERKGVFDDYYRLRQRVLGLDALKPYDLSIQLMKDPGRKYSYSQSLDEILASFGRMDPAFGQIFIETVTGGYVDVYPNPAGGKQSGAYCQALCARNSPALILLNFKGLMDDESTIAHEMGHAINFRLMGRSVDLLYCGGPEYEMEVASTFNEELLLDRVIKSSDRETAMAFLADHIRTYENVFTFQPHITEFEHRAHRLVAENGRVSGQELNALWDEIFRDYRSDLVQWYPENDARWTYVSHIYLTNNYYTFSYALSEAITLALFKKYQEDPVSFNRNYLAYLSAGTSMTPPEKLRRYFGLEIDRRLFEDAMDVVAMRVSQLQELAG